MTLRSPAATDNFVTPVRRAANSPPRIGITGSAGVGKTTLALTLAATVGLPVAEEPMRARIEAGHSLQGMSRDEHRDTLRRDAEAVCRQLQQDGGLVCDRTPLDYLAFWFCNGYGADDPVATDRFVAEAAAAMSRFDMVLVLPWAALPLVDDGVRYANPWHQLHLQAMIEGLCARYVEPARLALMPMAIDQPDTRCAWVLKRLRIAA